MGQILSLLSEVFSRCTAWFLQTMEAVDGVGVWLTAIVMCLCFRYLLFPVIGGKFDALSDKAVNSYKKRSTRPYRLDHKGRIR